MSRMALDPAGPPPQHSVESLLGLLEGLGADLRKSTPKQVQSRTLKNRAKTIVTEYFATLRPAMVSSGVKETHLAELDQHLQDLLVLTQKDSLRKHYVECIKNAANAAKDVEVVSLTAVHQPQRPVWAPQDAQLVAALASMVPTAAMSYEQACLDLQEPDRRSYRGVACELREALREVLDHLAPNDQVVKAKGFKLEKDCNRPTMKQKAVFILKARQLGQTALRAPRDAVDAVEEKIASLARSVYERGSLHAHVESARQEVLNLKRYVDVVLAELLEL